MSITYSVENLLLDDPQLDYESMLGPVVRMRWIGNLLRLAILEELDQLHAAAGEYTEHEAEIRRLRRSSMAPDAGRYYPVDGKSNRIFKNLDPEQARQIVEHWLTRQPIPLGAGRDSVEHEEADYPNNGYPRSDDLAGDEQLRSPSGSDGERPRAVVRSLNALRDGDNDNSDKYLDNVPDDEFVDAEHHTDNLGCHWLASALKNEEQESEAPIDTLTNRESAAGFRLPPSFRPSAPPSSVIARPLASVSHSRLSARQTPPALPALSEVEGSAVEGKQQTQNTKHQTRTRTSRIAQIVTVAALTALAALLILAAMWFATLRWKLGSEGSLPNPEPQTENLPTPNTRPSLPSPGSHTSTVINATNASQLERPNTKHQTQNTQKTGPQATGPPIAVPRYQPYNPQELR